MPKNKYCQACQRAKAQHVAARRGAGDANPKPTRFGQAMTADHLVAQSEKSQGLTGEADALVVFDRGTKWLDCYPMMTRLAITDFVGRTTV